MKTFEEFCKAIGQKESSCNYQAKNSFGYLGYYQFGMARLCDLGLTRRKRSESTSMANDAFEWIPPYSESLFLGTPVLQYEAFVRHIELLVERIGEELLIPPGEQPSLSGCVAVAHLLGFEAMKDYFLFGIDGHDANGTKASDYFHLFAGYRMPVDASLHSIGVITSGTKGLVV